MNDQDVGLGRPDVTQLEQHEASGLSSVRWAWQQLQANAQYYFQSLEWMERVAALIDGDAVWGVLTESGLPTAVSVLERSQKRRAGFALKVLSDARVGDMRYPFTDCLLDANPAGRRAVDIDSIAGISGGWDVLDIKGRRVGSPWLELAVGKAYVREEPDGGVGVLDTRAAADEWWRSLPKNMRDSVRKTRGRIAASGGSEVAVATTAEIPAAYKEFCGLEASGWKGAKGTALRQRPAWQDLLGSYLSVADNAQVRSLRIGDRLAASQISVTFGGSLFLLKVAYDEELANLSPGNVLMANLVEECCETPGIDRIDCTVWQEWHQRWGMVREPTYRVLAFNHRSLGGIAVGAAWNARRLLNRQGEWQIPGAADHHFP